MKRKTLLIFVLPLFFMGCEAWTESDDARSVTGPSITVHCDAATPVGDTTAKIACPTAIPTATVTGTRRAH